MPTSATSRSLGSRWYGRRMKVASWPKRGDLKASCGWNFGIARGLDVALRRRSQALERGHETLGRRRRRSPGLEQDVLRGHERPVEHAVLLLVLFEGGAL